MNKLERFQQRHGLSSAAALKTYQAEQRRIRAIPRRELPLRDEAKEKAFQARIQAQRFDANGKLRSCC